MPHASFKLLPGVDQNKTPALNEAAISNSQLIRFIPDRTLGGLVQKLGGWTKFFPDAIGSIVRCLWAWEDTNSNSYLAVGAEGIGAGGGQALEVINGGIETDITPQNFISDTSVDFSTVSGSNTVTIVDSNFSVDPYDVVDIQTQVSVGGIVLFGQYQVTPVSGTSYTIDAKNALGEPSLATSTVSNGGSVPEYNSVSGSDFITVNLANHGYQVGSTFPALVATVVGGSLIYGNYIVIEVTSPDSFVISANTQATNTSSIFQNNGNVYFVYHNGIGPVQFGSGYGVGGYGVGGYGSGSPYTPDLGTPINSPDWTLDNWGEILISCPIGGPIYQWSPSSGNQIATVIANAPPANEGMFVAMPQRQIIAWGSTFTGIVDPLLIRWCDVNDFDSWIALITNQAGSYRIPKGSRIVQCIQGPQQGLIWTDLGVWSMQYAGPPYVYQFNELGTGCGLIGRKAAASMNGVVYWMGQSQFFRLAGGGVEPIRCPIWDVIFQDLDTGALDKIRIAPNSRFGEIAWYYPTNSNGGEVSHYVKYNVLLNEWDYGELARTAWINESVLGPPIGAGANTYIYQHETSPDADGAPMVSSFQTGYFVMTEADVKMFIDQIWPDMKWGYYGGTQDANIKLTFYVTDYAGQTPLAYGPYTLTQAVKFITPRFRGRLVSIKIESDDIGTFWRLGNIRYRFQQDGKF